MSKCAYEDCEREGTIPACGKRKYPDVANYCYEHALLVQEDGNPEYTVDCPNCGCRFGVN